MGQVPEWLRSLTMIAVSVAGGALFLWLVAVALSFGIEFMSAILIPAWGMSRGD